MASKSVIVSTVGLAAIVLGGCAKAIHDSGDSDGVKVIAGVSCLVVGVAAGVAGWFAVEEGITGMTS